MGLFGSFLPMNLAGCGLGHLWASYGLFYPWQGLLLAINTMLGIVSNTQAVGNARECARTNLANFGDSPTGRTSVSLPSRSSPKPCKGENREMLCVT